MSIVDQGQTMEHFAARVI